MTDLEKKERKRKYNKKYTENNKEKIKEYYETNKEKIKKYQENNKQKIIKNSKIYYKNNKLKLNQKSKEYYKNNKEKINKNCVNYQKLRISIDYLYKLTCNVKTLIRMSIKKQGFTKKSKTFQILGCSYEDFKQHLERQFLKGMSWDNRSEWHLDHIIPVSLAKDEQELIKLNHYTNFQPMWAVENIIKGNKIIPNTQIKLV
jgi:hypothetical protein